MKTFLSDYQCGLRKGYSTQFFFSSSSEIEIKPKMITFSTDLSKLFYCLYHELLLAKLHAYGSV